MDNTTAQQWLTRCGYLLIFCFLGGVGLSDVWFPAFYSPLLDAQGVATMYQEHTFGIRLLAILFVLGSAANSAWLAAMAGQIRRIENSSSPSLTYALLVGGVMGIMLFLAAAVFFAGASFRPDRSPEIIQALSDIAMFWLLWPGFPLIVQCWACGAAVLSDKRADPILPRWFGYLSVWCGISFIPAVLCIFFKTGPFNWPGLFIWWIPAAVFCIWVISSCICLEKAVKRQALDKDFL